MILFNDEPELDIWDGDECNALIGTDSTIFPPFMTKEQGLWTFEPFLCRSVKVVYERPSKYSGLPTLHYIMDFGDIAVNDLFKRIKMPTDINILLLFSLSRVTKNCIVFVQTMNVQRKEQ